MQRQQSAPLFLPQMRDIWQEMSDVSQAAIRTLQRGNVEQFVAHFQQERYRIGHERTRISHETVPTYTDLVRAATDGDMQKQMTSLLETSAVSAGLYLLLERAVTAVTQAADGIPISQASQTLLNVWPAVYVAATFTIWNLTTAALTGRHTLLTQFQEDAFQEGVAILRSSLSQLRNTPLHPPSEATDSLFHALDVANGWLFPEDRLRSDLTLQTTLKEKLEGELREVMKQIRSEQVELIHLEEMLDQVKLAYLRLTAEGRQATAVKVEEMESLHRLADIWQNQTVDASYELILTRLSEVIARVTELELQHETLQDSLDQRLGQLLQTRHQQDEANAVARLSERQPFFLKHAVEAYRHLYSKGLHETQDGVPTQKVAEVLQRHAVNTETIAELVLLAMDTTRQPSLLLRNTASTLSENMPHPLSILSALAHRANIGFGRTTLPPMRDETGRFLLLRPLGLHLVHQCPASLPHQPDGDTHRTVTQEDIFMLVMHQLNVSYAYANQDPKGFLAEELAGDLTASPERLPPELGRWINATEKTQRVVACPKHVARQCANNALAKEGLLALVGQEQTQQATSSRSAG